VETPITLMQVVHGKMGMDKPLMQYYAGNVLIVIYSTVRPSQAWKLDCGCNSTIRNNHTTL